MSELITIQNVRGRLLPDGTVQLHLEDVARGLGFIQVKSGTQYVRWERVNRYLAEMGFPQLVGKQFIPENVFYRLAMKGETDSAVQFQIKVADEILPSIRKHGAYMTPQKIEEVLMNPDTIIHLATQLKQEREAKQRLEAQIEADKPKVIFAEALQVSSDSILIAHLAKLLKQNGIDIGQNRLFERLRKDGYLGKVGGYYNMPTQRAMDLKLFEIQERVIQKPDGDSIVSKTPRVTGKGQMYFINKFKSELASGQPVEA